MLAGKTAPLPPATRWRVPMILICLMAFADTFGGLFQELYRL